MTMFKGLDPAAVFQGLHLVQILKDRLGKGFRFYRHGTEERLETVDEITKWLQKGGAVDQRPPEMEKERQKE